MEYIKTYDFKSSLCLLSNSVGDWFFGMVNLPQRNISVSEYNTLLQTKIENLICVSFAQSLPKTRTLQELRIESVLDEEVLIKRCFLGLSDADCYNSVSSTVYGFSLIDLLNAVFKFTDKKQSFNNYVFHLLKKISDEIKEEERLLKEKQELKDEIQDIFDRIPPIENDLPF